MMSTAFFKALETARARLTAEFIQLTRDGLSIREAFAFFFACTGELAALGKEYMETPEDEKKSIILSSMRMIYKRNNPDIPFLPEPFETMLEHLLLTQALPAAYDFLVQRN